MLYQPNPSRARLTEGVAVMRRRTLLALLVLVAVVSVRPAAADGLDLHGGRFHVTAEWHTPDGNQGYGFALPLTQETGMFWFFSPSNVELVVKVLDACTLFQRYWVFASGLTDVNVILTVEDRWTGHVERYERAGGTLFAPLADTSRFAVCAATQPCGHGNLADILASPRPDRGAEELALLLGTGVAADEQIYQRLHADLAAIRAADPLLASRDFRNIWWDSQSLVLALTTEAWQAINAGTYSEWNCLNAWYRGSKRMVGTLESNPWASLTFAGSLHPYRIAPDYAALQGVTFAEPNFFGYPACEGCTPSPGLCAISDESIIYDYFIEDGETWYNNGFNRYRLPIRHYRVVAPGAVPTLV